MSAELPIFERYVSRRTFLHGSVVAGTSGLIYAAAAPLLAGCGSESSSDVTLASAREIAQGEIPERHFTVIREAWNAEPKLEFTEIVVPHLAWLSENKLTIDGKTMELPFRPDASPELAFSPDGNYLAVWISRRQGSRSQTLHRVSVLDLNNSEEKPFIEQTFDNSICYLKWAQNGRHLLVNISSSGTYLPPRYPYGPMGNLDIYTYVYDCKSKQELLAIRGQQGVNISPNGELIVLAIRQNQHYLYNMEKKKVIADIDPVHSAFDWSPDSRFLASVMSSEKTVVKEPIGGGSILVEKLVGEHQLAVFNTADGEKVYSRPIGHPSSVGVRFTPDGKRLLFMDGTARADRLAVLNLERDSIERMIEGVKISSATPFLPLEQNVLFPTKDVLVVLGGSVSPYLDFVDLNSGQVRREEIVRVADDGAPVVSRDGFIGDDTLGIWDYSGARGTRGYRHYLYNFITKTPVFVSEETPEVGKNIALGVSSAKDGDLLSTGDETLLLKDGRKYSAGAGIVELLNSGRPVRNIISSLIENVPYSENELDFGAGDILIGPGGRGWYLQNGGRYEIPGRVEDFAQTRRKNFRVREVPTWVLERIKENRLPLATFRYLDRWTIDARSPLLIVLYSGLASTLDGAPRDWDEVVKGLLSIGWKESQIVFGTYNFNITPQSYNQEHSTRFPGENRDAARRLVGWLKEQCPLTRFLLWGHSEGADLAFNAALSHVDSICQIGSINGPLKGVDRTLVSAGPFEFEELAYFSGCESWPIDDKCEAIRFYTALGENSSYAQQVEDQVQWLREHGVEVFNASNQKDPLVGPKQAILENSERRVGNYNLKNLWDVPTSTSGPLGPHGILLRHQPFIKEFVLPAVGRP